MDGGPTGGFKPWLGDSEVSRPEMIHGRSRSLAGGVDIFFFFFFFSSWVVFIPPLAPASTGTGPFVI